MNIFKSCIDWRFCLKTPFIEGANFIECKFHFSIKICNLFFFIAGISNIVGKLVTGRFSDISCIDSFLLSNTYIFMSGVSAFFLPLCDSYELFVPVVAFYGFFTTFFMLKTIILVELLGLDNLTSAYSLIAFFEGIASIGKSIV